MHEFSGRVQNVKNIVTVLLWIILWGNLSYTFTNHLHFDLPLYHFAENQFETFFLMINVASIFVFVFLLTCTWLYNLDDLKNDFIKCWTG